MLATQPSTLGRTVERLAERDAVHFVLAMRADDGEDNSPFETGDITLIVPRGWHYSRGEGSRMAVPCDDSDSADEDGSILGPITVEKAWHATSVDVSFTSSVMNPLPIPVELSAFSFDIFHDDGDDEFLATARLIEPLTMPALTEDSFTVATNVPYSIDMLSAGLDWFEGNLVLGARNGVIDFTLGDSFVVSVSLRHQNLVVSTCEAGVVSGQVFADGFCHRDTGETCSVNACPVELGATDCTTTAFGVQDRCDCAPGFCLTSSETIEASRYVHGTPVCARMIESVQPLFDGTTPLGHWDDEVCESVESYSVCNGVCAMQLSQTGSLSDGVRVTTRCADVAFGECDCGFVFCSTERICACERCTEVWVPGGNGRR
jgi:hypothetical protein